MRSPHSEAGSTFVNHPFGERANRHIRGGSPTSEKPRTWPLVPQRIFAVMFQFGSQTQPEASLSSWLLIFPPACGIPRLLCETYLRRSRSLRRDNVQSELGKVANWNEDTWATKRGTRTGDACTPAQPSPIIGWLARVKCPRSETRASIPLDVIRRPRDTRSGNGRRRGRRLSRGTRRYKPPDHMVKLRSQSLLTINRPKPWLPNNYAILPPHMREVSLVVWVSF